MWNINFHGKCSISPSLSNVHQNKCFCWWNWWKNKCVHHVCLKALISHQFHQQKHLFWWKFHKIGEIENVYWVHRENFFLLLYIHFTYFYENSPILCKFHLFYENSPIFIEFQLYNLNSPILFKVHLFYWHFTYCMKIHLFLWKSSILCCF